MSITVVEGNPLGWPLKVLVSSEKCLNWSLLIITTQKWVWGWDNADCPESRKKGMWVVAPEEMTVVKKEFIYSHVVPEVSLCSSRKHAYHFCNWLKPNSLHKVIHNVFSRRGTKWIKCVLCIYVSIVCAIIGLVACILYHQKATKKTFLTVYITSS